ncbi:MAG: phosphatase PAP2 family protein [bacterium]|nr:phosphatase PAP2 family protein [bacterium]
MNILFQDFFANLSGVFRGRNLYWHLLAVLLTLGLVLSGFDWYYATITRGGVVAKILFPAVFFGGLLPIILPLVIVTLGAVKRSAYTIRAGWATGQAAIVGLLASFFYKALTGRAHPELISAALGDISRVFHFGFLRGGVFWGWPSSHTTVAFAVAAALATLYPKNTYVVYLGFLYALYVGFGVSMSIHWFSDAVAGAIIGIVAGVTIGKSFLNPKI